MNFVFTYRFSLILLLSILSGGIVGHFLGPKALVLRPLIVFFLDALLVLIGPLLFFSMASAIANIGLLSRLKRIFSTMLLVFLITGLIAALYMMCVVLLFHPASPQTGDAASFSEKINAMNFSHLTSLLRPSWILTLGILAIVVGIITHGLGEKAQSFARFLKSAADALMKGVTLLLYYAPIGFFAFFAIGINQFGIQLFNCYVQTTVIYYIFGFLYLFIAFTAYAYWSEPHHGLQLFWKNIFPPALTALVTLSSAASMPVNLQAAKQMKIPADIYEIVIPLGTFLNKQGSILGAVLKIAFLLGIYHISFFSPKILLTVPFIAVLVGTVIGAIPSGGMMGEMFILSIYGFPPQALMMVLAISIFIDPLATVLNVIGNTTNALLVTRSVEGKYWLKTRTVSKPHG